MHRPVRGGGPERSFVVKNFGNFWLHCTQEFTVSVVSHDG